MPCDWDDERWVYSTCACTRARHASGVRGGVSFTCVSTEQLVALLIPRDPERELINQTVESHLWCQGEWERSVRCQGEWERSVWCQGEWERSVGGAWVERGRGGERGTRGGRERGGREGDERGGTSYSTYIIVPVGIVPPRDDNFR